MLIAFYELKLSGYGAVITLLEELVFFSTGTGGCVLLVV